MSCSADMGTGGAAQHVEVQACCHGRTMHGKPHNHARSALTLTGVKERRASCASVVPMARCVLTASASMYTGTGVAPANGSAGAHRAISAGSRPCSRPWSCEAQQLSDRPQNR